jgi:hypothetical protein
MRTKLAPGDNGLMSERAFFEYRAKLIAPLILKTTANQSIA